VSQSIFNIPRLMEAELRQGLLSRLAGRAAASARISPGCLQQLFEFFNCFGVLRTDWVVAAAGIRSLQSTNHRRRSRERRATLSSLTMASVGIN
jgi:hypothetical protein